MTFAPGVLSTWRPPPTSETTYPSWMSYAVGDVWLDPIGDPDIDESDNFFPLNVADLACPSWGLGTNTSADDTVVTTIGPPWLPVIVPPVEVFSLDPTWALHCTGMLSDPFIMSSFVLFDPPVALTRGSGLVPAPAPNKADPTTVPDKQAAPSTAAAKPANPPVVPADPPARTEDPGRESPRPSLAIASGDPARPASPPGEPVATPTNKIDPPLETRVTRVIGSENPSSSQDDPWADPKVSNSVAPAVSGIENEYPPADPTNSTPGGPQTAPASLQAPAQPAPQQDDSQSQAQRLGAIIYNAFGRSGPKFDDTTNTVNTISIPTTGTQKLSMDNGQVLSIDPSGIEFQGKKFSVGGPAMTLSNSVYTFVAQLESGANAAGDGQNLGGPLSVAPDTLTIAGQTMMPNPTGFVLKGTIISPGGAPQIVDGTIIKLGPSGVLTIGSPTISLLAPSSTPPVLTVAGQTFTPNPTAFSIAGTTISVDGPAITLAGTTISLEASGTLIVGSSKIPLPIPQISLSSLVKIDELSVEALSSLAIIDGVTIKPGAPGVTVDGSVVSLEAGGATLDVGTGRFAMPTEGSANGSGGTVAFQGGQGRIVAVPLFLLLVMAVTLMALLI